MRKRGVLPAGSPIAIAPSPAFHWRRLLVRHGRPSDHRSRRRAHLAGFEASHALDGGKADLGHAPYGYAIELQVADQANGPLPTLPVRARQLRLRLVQLKAQLGPTLRLWAKAVQRLTPSTPFLTSGQRSLHTSSRTRAAALVWPPRPHVVAYASTLRCIGPGPSGKRGSP